MRPLGDSLMSTNEGVFNSLEHCLLGPQEIAEGSIFGSDSHDEKMRRAVGMTRTKTTMRLLCSMIMIIFAFAYSHCRCTKSTSFASIHQRRPSIPFPSVWANDPSSTLHPPRPDSTFADVLLLDKGFGNVDALDSLQIEWLTIPIFTGVLSCIVQLFYAYRVVVLSRSKIMGLVIAVVSVVQSTSAVVQGVQAVIINDFSSNLRSKAFASEVIWLVGSAVCDLMIVAFMTYALLKKHIYIKSTQTIVTRIIRIIVETGCLTAVAATLLAVLFFAFPDKTYFTCVGLVLAKLYSNSFLVILNTRVEIVGGRNQVSRVAMGNSIATRSHLDFANRTTKTTSAGPTSRIVFNTNPGVGESLPTPSFSETLHTNSGKGDLESWLEQGETNFDIRLEDQIPTDTRGHAI